MEPYHVGGRAYFLVPYVEVADVLAETLPNIRRMCEFDRLSILISESSSGSFPLEKQKKTRSLTG